MARFHKNGNPDQRVPALTTADVTLRPQHNDKVPNRRLADLGPTDFPGSPHGIVLANMNSVAGRRSSLVAALYGGLSVLPQDMDDDTLRRVIIAIKTADTWCEPALTLKATDTILEAQALMKKMSHDMIVVIDDDCHPVGVISESDYWDSGRRNFKRSEHAAVSTIMRTDVRMLRYPDLDAMSRDDSYANAFYQLYEWNVSSAPVVDDDGRLVGVMTKFFAGVHARSRQKPDLPPIIRKPSLDNQGRLMIAAAIGINQNVAEKARFLISLGVDVLVIDTAHGDSAMMIRAIKTARAAVGQSACIVAGNVCTAEAVSRFINAGASGVKIGVGPGAVCTTREVTGHGCPQFEAVLECAAEAKRLGAFVWADGGIKLPGDVVKLEGAGATRCMIGTIAAGVYESPGRLMADDTGREYKDNSGMASLAAVTSRNVNGGDPLEVFIRSQYVEGASGRTYVHPERPHLGALITWMATGHQSGRSYSNALTQADMHEGAIFQVQGQAGKIEGTPNGTRQNG